MSAVGRSGGAIVDRLGGGGAAATRRAGAGRRGRGVRGSGGVAGGPHGFVAGLLARMGGDAVQERPADSRFVDTDGAGESQCKDAASILQESGNLVRAQIASVVALDRDQDIADRGLWFASGCRAFSDESLNLECPIWKFSKKDSKIFLHTYNDKMFMRKAERFPLMSLSSINFL